MIFTSWLRFLLKNKINEGNGVIKKTFGKRWIYIMGNKDLITNNNENKFVEKTLRCCF